MAVDYFSFTYHPESVELDRTLRGRKETTYHVVQGVRVTLRLPPSDITVHQSTKESHFDLDPAPRDAPVLLEVHATLSYRPEVEGAKKKVENVLRILRTDPHEMHHLLRLKKHEETQWAPGHYGGTVYTYEFLDGGRAIRASSLTPERLVELSKTAQAVLEWLVARKRELFELEDAIIRQGWKFVQKARAHNKGVPEREIGKVVDRAVRRVRAEIQKRRERGK